MKKNKGRIENKCYHRADMINIEWWSWHPNSGYWYPCNYNDKYESFERSQSMRQTCPYNRIRKHHQAYQINIPFQRSSPQIVARVGQNRGALKTYYIDWSVERQSLWKKGPMFLR
jgi:hypothetical protein